jgi:Family of unknown function (DUF5681)
MVWKNGQSGNPGGRPREKEFAAQLRLVLAEAVDENDPKSVRKMRRIAEKLVDCALAGEPWAIAQVADRLDGRPTQILEHAGGGEMRVIVTSALVREQQIVDADYQEAETVPTKLIGTNGSNGHA